MHILFVHSEPLTRAGFQQIVGAKYSEWKISAAPNMDAVGDVLSREDVDLVLIEFPGLDFTELEQIPNIRAKTGDIPLLLYVEKVGLNIASASIAAGIKGLIPRDTEPAVVLAALRLVEDGGIYVPPSVFAHMPTPAPASPHALADQPQAEYIGASSGQLTKRQRDVLRCIGEGMSNRDIAEQLGLSEGTVKIHVYNIFKALKVRNRVAALVEARRQGLLSAETA